MKIDEVMLGDIVSVSGRPIHVTLAVLNNWSDSIQPIQLTPEILEKNGFKKNELIESYNHYCGMDNRVSLNDDIDSEDYCTIANCELTYVHELQHILRLCEIDKEIVV